MLGATREDYSWRRALGLTLHLLWMLLLFYTLTPFFLSTDARESSYIYMTISLCALVLSLGFFFVTMKRGESLDDKNPLVIGATALTVVGTAAAIASDSQTTIGMLMLGIGSILTGIASAVIYTAWLARYVAIPRKLFFIELCTCYVVALAITAALAALPSAVGCAVCLVVPLASAALLLKTRGEGVKPPIYADKKLSRNSYLLFVKALVGAFLFGMLEGFIDAFAGAGTQATFQVFGLPLLVDAALALVVLTVLALLVKHDGTFMAYRFSIFIMGLGCLLIAFPDIPYLGSGLLMFAGYLCFTVTLVAVCADIAVSFGIGMTRSLCIGFVALFAGEVAGVALSMSTADALAFNGANTMVALIMTCMLFFAHLFLFTETDLAHIGVGELAEGTAGNNELTDEQKVRPYEGTATAPHERHERITAICAERYGLSPRECEVLPLLLQGRTIARIQETLYISQGTVSTHIRHIYQKCGVASRQELLDLCEQVAEGDETPR